MADLVTVTPQGLYCPAGDFHIDPWQPVARALLTHAHGDHARPGSGAYLCAREGLPVVQHRLPEASVEGLPYRETRRLGEVVVSLHPAGHVLGSAQVRIERAGEVWVVSGDYKRAPDPTCAPFEPVRAQVFITEATFGLPVFRWDPTAAVLGDLVHWWVGNRARDRASVLFCYALGKAQRILAELRGKAPGRIFVHGSIDGMTSVYRSAGVAMEATERVADTARGRDFAGDLVLAPVSARGTPWMRRFGDAGVAMASGLMRVRGERRRRTLERGFPLSDHADWPALLQTVQETGAARVLVTHGYAVPFARALRERGLDAEALETPFEGEPGS